MTHSRAILLLVVVAIFWSSGGLLIKMVDLHPLAIASARSFIGALVILFYQRKLNFLWSKPQFGVAISFALTVILFVLANKLTTAANAILLQYTAPVYVALLSWPLLKEKVTIRDWIAIGIILAGMLLFFIDKVDMQYVLGNSVAILSGIAFAGIAIGLRLQKGKSILESIFLGHCLTALIGLPFLFQSEVLDTKEIITLVVLGIFQLGLPYILYGIAIKHVSALEATLIPVIEPILNPIWVFLAFGEIPGWWALAGGGLVIAGVLFQSIVSSRNKAVSA